MLAFSLRIALNFLQTPSRFELFPISPPRQNSTTISTPWQKNARNAAAWPSASTKDTYERPSHLLEDLHWRWTQRANIFFHHVENHGPSYQAQSQQNQGTSQQEDCVCQGDRQGGFWVRCAEKILLGGWRLMECRLAPYERRVIELLRNSKDKRARKLAKKRVCFRSCPCYDAPLTIAIARYFRTCQGEGWWAPACDRWG